MSKQKGVCIKLDNDVVLTSDAFQWVLSGKHRRDGYFTTLEEALKGYLDSSLRSSDSKTIGELIEQLKIVTASLKATIMTSKFNR